MPTEPIKGEATVHARDSKSSYGCDRVKAHVWCNRKHIASFSWHEYSGQYYPLGRAAAEANAAFYADAVNVYTESGMTPRQLWERLQELEEERSHPR